MDKDVAGAAPERVPLGDARNLTKADVFLDSRGGREVVVKSLERRPLLARLLLGGLLLRREARALSRLAGMPGIPRLIEATPTSLVLEPVPGATLFARRKTGMSPATAESFERLVADLHARGFAHGDIGRRDVLVAEDGTVRLVDFATAVGPGLPPVLWRLLLPYWRHRDRARMGKLIRRYRRRWDGNIRRAAPQG